jgi:uncharacterized protein YeaO (DUF488 family)
VTEPAVAFGQRADELLRVLELDSADGTVVADYSTGMRKKITLATALLHSPRLLALDEPFEAVDPVSAASIRVGNGQNLPERQAMTARTAPVAPACGPDPVGRPPRVTTRLEVKSVVPLDVQVGRVYDEPAANGTRVLVDRLWPRGLRKDAARLDAWAKDVAPSSELRTWYGHDPARFDEFRRRYLAELAGSTQRAALDRLRALASAPGLLILLTATRDVDHSQAAVLAELLRPTADPADPAGPAEGGEAACFAHLVCPECGAVVTEGHREGCALARAASP